MAARESALWAQSKGNLPGLVRQYTVDGRTDWRQVATAVGGGVTANAVRFKWKSLDSALPEETPKALPAPLVLVDRKPDPFEGLEPIHLAPPPPPTRLVRSTETTVVGSDFHFGPDTHSPEHEEVFLNVIADLRPQTVILNGDLSDMLAISKYPKDVRRIQSLGSERKQYHQFLYRLHAIVDEWNGRIIETNGNHSGDGHEGRWWRYLSDRIPEVAGDPEFQAKLDYKAMWMPSWARVELVEDFTVVPGLIVLHGDVVRGHAAYSARGMLEKWRHSLIHGHTHRTGRYGYHVPPVAGKKSHQMRAWEGGCLCSMRPIYGSGKAVNWQPGFTIVRHDEVGGFGVEQVDIINHEAVVCSLGATFRASA